jgi:hypothetical protein
MLDTNNLISSSESIFSKSNIFWFINSPAFKSLSQYLISLASFENTVNLFMKSLFEPTN